MIWNLKTESITELGSPVTKFKLLEDLNVRGYIVPAGTITDAETVRPPANLVIQRASNAFLASIAHDHRMKNATCLQDRIDAHRHFRDDLKYYGVGNAKAQLVYRTTILADDRIPFKIKINEALK